MIKTRNIQKILYIILCVNLKKWLKLIFFIRWKHINNISNITIPIEQQKNIDAEKKSCESDFIIYIYIIKYNKQL